MASRAPIKIKKSHEGLFSAKAKRAGMSTQAYARKEYHAPGALGKQARFAANAANWNHPREHSSKHN